MPTATRTFRVFVSSTFEDLKVERDALQRKVFPRLRKLCEENNARFQAIDLRWGVRDEAALDQQTMEICLREIERCQQTGTKPNFIVLLGERYGWRPLPARIEAGEFKKVCERAADADKRLIGDWYERDDNAVPSEFLLKPRTGAFVDRERWGEVERKLHGILREAAREAGLAADALVKYDASATHQEILAGLGTAEADRQHVFAFCRNFRDEACGPELAGLRRWLKTQLPDKNFVSYEPGDLSGLCRDVERTLSAVIEAHAQAFESRPALDLETDAHDAFARERSLLFGRDQVLAAIAAYLRSPATTPLVLHGLSGSGKSAVMAQASDQALRLPSAVLVRRFIGVTPDSSSGLTLLRSLCGQIGAAYGASGEIPVDFNAVSRLFAERLALATPERPFVLFLDAPDQLGNDDPARSLAWLPSVLPANCRIVLSTTELSPAIRQFRLIQLDPLPEAHAGQALDRWLAAARRTLTPAQRSHVIAAFSRCGLPLYLKLAFEDGRLWPSSLPIAECRLGEGVQGIIDTLLNRLSLESNHGPLLVSRSLGYLAAARYGLTEDEMLDVLSADHEVWDDFLHRARHTPPEQRLPIVVWSRLFLDLEPYLTERSAPGAPVVTFYHRQLAERVAARILAANEDQPRHQSLAAYFAARPNWLDGETRKNPNARKCAELPWQQRAAGLWRESESTLLDTPFLFAKVESALALDLDSDYRALLSEAPNGSLEKRGAVSLIGGALRLSGNALMRDSRQFASHVVGRLLGDNGSPAIRRFLDEVAAGAPRPWLRPLQPALLPPGRPLIRVLEGHSGLVWGAAVTPDGRRAVSASWDKTLKVWDLESGRVLRALEGHSDWVRGVAVSPDGRRAVSASDDKTLKVWDLENGRMLRTLEGHSDFVNGVALSPDGRRAVSASDDKTLKVWGLESGRVLRTLEGHSEEVNGVAVTPDAKRVVSASWDKTLKVWDLESGRDLRTLEGHSSSVNGVAITHDGRRAVSASDDKTLKVWDLENGRMLRTLEGHLEEVHGVAVSPDGRRAISASDDKTLKIWSLENGRMLLTLEGHSEGVRGVAVSPDGRRAVSASDDKTLKVWDLENGRMLRTLEGHSSGVSGIAVTTEGRRAVSASWDKTLKVWDLESGRVVRTLEGHWSSVNGVAITHDGRRAVSASRDYTLKVWDLESGRVLRTLEGHSAWVDAVAATPDGRRAVSASWDKTLKVWDLESGRFVQTLEGHSKRVNDVAVSPDGRRAVSASDDKTLKVWDLESGRVLRTLEGHSEEVNGVAVTPNGRRAVSASQDKSLKVWDLESGRVLQTLEGHSDWVLGVAVSLNGRRAVSASWDRTLKVWDLNSGVVIATFVCDAAIECCAFLDPSRMVGGDRLGRLHWLELVD